MNNPKVAIIELTSCAGCECALLAQGEKFLELLENIELVEFRFLEEETERTKFYDLAFVVGTPSTKKQRTLLTKVRKKAKILVAFGNCSIFGSVWAAKNWRDKEKIIKYVYKNPKGIDNFPVTGVSGVVRVDHEIPTCPINGKEFLRMTYELLGGRAPRLALRTVCYECQINEYECILQKGEPCLGPITLGGCEAICLKSKMPCEGCRGPCPGSNFKSFFNLLRKNIGAKRAAEILEIFGVKDRFLAELKKVEDNR